jgi:hypothetical protein
MTDGSSLLPKNTGPRHHIERSRLPWRVEADTECGRPIAEIAEDFVVTREDAVRFWKDQGQQRAALYFCVTCVQTANRWQSWEDDPAQRLGRELQSAGWGFGQTHDLIRAELRAIEALIATYPDEFATLRDGYLGGNFVPMAELRKRRAATNAEQARIRRQYGATRGEGS